MAGFVAVHTGAGEYGNKELLLRYRKVCEEACKSGIAVLKGGGSAVDAAVASTIVLEDEPLTNAGRGSCLSSNGSVECDACIMRGDNLAHGSVGVVSNMKNPILVAKGLLDYQLASGDSRLPPCTLVGEGASQFAQGILKLDPVPPSYLVTKRAVKQYVKCKRLLCGPGSVTQEEENIALAHCEPSVGTTVDLVLPDDSELDSPSLDTVGVVCIDKYGIVASACSSGGIAVKHPGRLGPAALFGCGCYAHNAEDFGNADIAITVSGAGEHIIKTNLAKSIAFDLRSTHGMPSLTLKSSVEKSFIESPLLRDVPRKLFGALVIYNHPIYRELLWVHTTPGMCIGYGSTLRDNITVHHSQLTRKHEICLQQSMCLGGTGIPE